MAARRLHQHRSQGSQVYVTRDHFVAQGLYSLGTHLAPAQDAPLPASRTSQEERWAAHAACHEWHFDEARAWTRAKRLQQLERVLVRLLSGQAERDGWHWSSPCSLDTLLPILMTNETGLAGRTTRTDEWRSIDASEHDTRAITRPPAPFAVTPVGLDAAAKASRTPDDALAALQLLGVGPIWSDTLAAAAWNYFPHRPCVDRERLGSLGEWTYRAAHDRLTGEDVRDEAAGDDMWRRFLMGHAVTQHTCKQSGQPEQVVRAPVDTARTDDLVTVGEAATLLHLTPAGIRQRIRRHHLHQVPVGRTHLVHLAELRHAS